MIIHADKSNFDTIVLKSELPVLVDFWAPWCRPCQTVLPVLEALSRDLDGIAKVVKVNADENPTLADRYKIMSIPTFIVFKNGEITNQTIGIHTKDNLKKLLKL
jgi:thioredoxin 1